MGAESEISAIGTRHEKPTPTSIILQVGSSPIETQFTLSYDINLLTDEEIVEQCINGDLPTRDLEKILPDLLRAVKIRRAVLSRQNPLVRGLSSFTRYLPFENYDYNSVLGVCCENVIGYMPIPIGVAGPLMIDGHNLFLPMATTEGALVASVCRGCKAVNMSGGVTTVLTADAMTRAPCLQFPNLHRAYAAKLWLESPFGTQIISGVFAASSRFAIFQDLQAVLVGELLYVRFRAKTGDAMGMNMISRCIKSALETMMQHGFDDMKVIAISANLCADKKPAATNWIEGRGKSVVAQSRVPSKVIEEVLKTDTTTLVSLNVIKNLTGSAIAGSIGGFNAHASNIVSSMFLATGQDVAQNVESSQCITTMSQVDGELLISVTMPSVEVGTVGGGTMLAPQASMLELLGVRGTGIQGPGHNAQKLARIIAAAVLAGELSLCSALASGHLVESHMKLNRK
ncbi:hypothetical protein B7463_g4442, partial [Scytalidium lignicola]